MGGIGSRLLWRLTGGVSTLSGGSGKAGRSRMLSERTRMLGCGRCRWFRRRSDRVRGLWSCTAVFLIWPLLFRISSNRKKRTQFGTHLLPGFPSSLSFRIRFMRLSRCRGLLIGNLRGRGLGAHIVRGRWRRWRRHCLMPGQTLPSWIGSSNLCLRLSCL